MPTQSQMLADLVAKRDAMQVQRETYRNLVVSRLTALANERPDWSRFRDPAAMERRQSTIRDQARAWATAIDQGSNPSLADIQANSALAVGDKVKGTNVWWSYFGAPPNLPKMTAQNAHTMAPVISRLNEQSRIANMAGYRNFVESEAQFQALNAQVIDLQNQGASALATSQTGIAIDNGTDPTSPTGGNNTPGDLGTTNPGTGSDPSTDPANQTPNAAGDTGAMADQNADPYAAPFRFNNRDRNRRDTAKIQFGTPKFGVGLNIPLGT